MLQLEKTAFILVDYQQRLLNVMHEKERLHENMLKLIQGLKVLKVPILWVEQYPKGLGVTVEDVQQLLKEESIEPIAKMDFSACQIKEIQGHIDRLDKKQYIVAGIEAHICVYQTVCELLKLGKHVEYVEDCLSSRTLENKQIAMRKMDLLGAYPTSVEMVLFELLQTAEHPSFKEISSIIK